MACNPIGYVNLLRLPAFCRKLVGSFSRQWKRLWIVYKRERISSKSFWFDVIKGAKKSCCLPPPQIHPPMKKRKASNYLTRRVSSTDSPAAECLSVSAPHDWHGPRFYVQALKIINNHHQQNFVDIVDNRRSIELFVCKHFFTSPSRFVIADSTWLPRDRLSCCLTTSNKLHVINNN